MTVPLFKYHSLRGLFICFYQVDDIPTSSADSDIYLTCETRLKLHLNRD